MDTDDYIAELQRLTPQERFSSICNLIHTERDDNILRAKLTAIFGTFRFAVSRVLYNQCKGDKDKLIELIIKNRNETEIRR